MSDRPLRYCDACLQLDDHPRHVRPLGKTEPDLEIPAVFLDNLTPGPPQAVMQLGNPRVAVRHMDCCAAAGCPDCIATEAENEQRRGQELIDHLAALREA